MGTPSALVVIGGLGGLQCFKPSDLAPLHLRVHQFEQGRVVVIIELRGVETSSALARCSTAHSISSRKRRAVGYCDRGLCSSLLRQERKPPAPHGRPSLP